MKEPAHVAVKGMNDDTTSTRSKRVPSEHWLALAVLVAGILLALQPLLAGHLPWRADGLLHVYRLVELERAVRHGVLFPRWLPDLGYGFGFPLFNYYAPLSYYLLLGLRALGLPVVVALQAGYALALASLCLGVYLWTQSLFGGLAGLVAAFAAAYAPYFLYDALHRGVLPELWGLAFLALALAAMQYHAARRGQRSLLLLVVAYAALILTHNILALVGSALLGAYGLFLVLHPPVPAASSGTAPLAKIASHPFAALALGLGVSAFFWLPALLERSLVQIEQLYGPANFYYGNNFLSLAEIVALPRATDPAQVNPAIAFGLGIPQILLAAAAWRPRAAALLTENQRTHRLVLTAAVAALLVMALPASQFLWDRLLLLYFVQFPWRFLGPASLLLAVLAGAGASRLPGPAWLRSVASVLLLAAAGLPWLFPGDYPAELALAPDDIIRFEAETGWLGTTSAGEYLPRAVETLPDPKTLLPLYVAAAPDYLIPRLDSASLPATGEIVGASYGLTQARIIVAAEAPYEARFLWYFFPGWKLTANGEPQALFADGPHGLLAAEIPAGQQTLELSFSDTPARRWSSYLSGASLVALVGAVLLAGTGRRLATARALHQVDRRTGLALILLGLLLFVAKGNVLDRFPNPFTRPAFDGQAVHGLDVPLQSNFGDELVLLGYDLEAGAVPADGVVELALYWRAQGELTEDYSVAVHLVDELGRRFGQQDSFHPAGYPTSRWLPGEYARDVHRVALAPGTPPGRYQLLISVYEPESGRRLEVGDAGLASGMAYRLAEVDVAPPTTAPDVVSLSLEHEASWGAGPLSLAGFDGPPESVGVGAPIALTFFWQAEAAPDADYLARLRLVDGEGKTAATMRWTPGRESFPTPLWEEGMVVRDERALLVPAAYGEAPDQVVASGRYALLLDLLDSSGIPVASEPLELGRIRVEAPARSFDEPAASSSIAQIGDLARLLAYDLGPTRVAPGEALTLRVRWRASSLTTSNYAVFVHLVGPDGEIAAQADQVPGGGTRPTTSWFPGEVITDSYTLTVPADAAAGVYRLRLGLYEPATGERLPVSGAGIADGDHLFLAESVVVTAGD